MTRDRHGNPLSGADAKAAEAYDTAVAQVGIYRGDPLGVLDAVLRDAPQMVMGHVAKAWLMAIATEPAATVEGRRVVAAARALPADERESSHLAALALVLDARWDESALALERHSARWPHDILALQAGHLMDFYRGNARAPARPHRPGAPALEHGRARRHARARHVRLRARGERATTRAPRTTGRARARRRAARLLGAPRGGPRDGDAGPRRGRHRLDDRARAAGGRATTTSSRCTTGGTARCATSISASRARPSRSTTARSAASRSAVALDLVDASALLWRLHARRPRRRRPMDRARRVPGTPTPTAGSTRSTTGTRRWPTSAPGATPTSSARSRPCARRCGSDAETARVDPRDRPAADARASRAFWRGDYAGGRRAGCSRRAFDREPLRRQPRAARRDRLDPDRGGAAQPASTTSPRRLRTSASL